MLERGFRHFVVLPDLERYSMSPAVTMWKTNLRSSLKTILGQQQERHVPIIAQNYFPIIGQMWLLTTGPLAGITVFFAELA